ncbi:hypothetical protein Tco_0211259 [Tanacetum coccineum]
MILILFMLNLGIPYAEEELIYHMTPVISELAVGYADWWLPLADSKLIQRGSTPVQRGKRRFLCYNMLGSVTTTKNDEYSRIEIYDNKAGMKDSCAKMDEKKWSIHTAGDMFDNIFSNELPSTVEAKKDRVLTEDAWRAQEIVKMNPEYEMLSNEHGETMKRGTLKIFGLSDTRLEMTDTKMKFLEDLAVSWISGDVQNNQIDQNASHMASTPRFHRAVIRCMTDMEWKSLKLRRKKGATQVGVLIIIDIAKQSFVISLSSAHFIYASDVPFETDSET